MGGRGATVTFQFNEITNGRKTNLLLLHTLNAGCEGGRKKSRKKSREPLEMLTSVEVRFVAELKRVRRSELARAE